MKNTGLGGIFPPDSGKKTSTKRDAKTGFGSKTGQRSKEDEHEERPLDDRKRDIEGEWF